jgi:hypothetical protein
VIVPVLAQVSLLLLSAVLLLSGVAKLLDLAGAAQALREFGVPDRVAHVGARVLPGVEVLVGLGMLVPPVAGWAALGAASLLVVFTAAMAVQLGLGKRPSCHCFGKLSSAPIGPATLVRNAVLTTLAVSLAWHAQLGTLGSWGWMGGLGWSDWLAVAAIVVSGITSVLLVALWVQQGRILQALSEAGVEGRLGATTGSERVADIGSGHQIGAQLPTLRVDTVQGVVELLEGGSADRPTLLAFVSTQCEPCVALLPTLHAWQTSETTPFDVAVIASGARARVAELEAEHRLKRVFYDDRGETARVLHVPATPAAVLVGPDRTVLTEVVTGATAVRLLATRLARAPHASVGGAGQPLIVDRAQRRVRGPDARRQAT